MTTVTALYESRVGSGQLKDDAAQRSALPAFDAVLESVAQSRPVQARSGWRRWFGTEDEAQTEGTRGLYIWGGVGRGKSMLMDLLMEAAPIPDKRRVHFHEFMQEIHAGLNEARKRGDRDAIRPVADGVAAKARLLCFDEMQITDIADAMIVGRLFEALFSHGVCIVTTSNRAPEELYKNGLNRHRFLPFIDLLHEKMEVLPLDSPHDHRQGRTTGEQVWFSPLNRETRADMEAIWTELTDGQPTPPMTVEVHGRKVEIAQHLGRMGRASFWDLCSRALGAADYLAIANAVDLLMIDDIPQLSSSNFNEAKRFVTLVDALYEAKVRVIASAAAEPERLYIEGEGSFEFERTASRLREMQDASWGRAKES
ncbi:cell division protein ZapE [Paracoccus albus]|uniref:cell division protein ZapE n=1 Tax=Paracoccus albus TaxID=3017784 RepID=UPI0022F04C7D|nr:cell division protein ZapE [Paracoccus albus]WBU61571.1 cell division protein ZapE [Paracoccus albus]